MKRLLPPACAIALAVSAAPAGAGGTTVKVENYKFVNRNITVSKGSKVTWKWSKGDDPHNVTFHGFHSKLQASGSYSHVFSKPGTYKYVCTIHAKSFAMHGTITVK